MWYMLFDECIYHELCRKGNATLAENEMLLFTVQQAQRISF